MESSTREELNRLLDALPSRINRLVHVDMDRVVEFVLDLGREVEVRYGDDWETIPGTNISEREIEEVLQQINEFGPDDRTGVDGTLHRISRIENRLGKCVGFTFRVGRNYPSNIELIQDLMLKDDSMLILCAPSSGKTTMLRSMASFLSTARRKRVVIIDTSNEIGGEGDVPHPAIGRARRMQVPTGKSQHEIMIRAVENHNPDVLIIDEISTEEETEAARTIAQRGIQLIATAHGRHLQDLVKNPPLCHLVGGVDKVTLSDDVVIRNGLKNKTRLERESEPTFGTVIELLSFTSMAVHTNVREAVDCMLSDGQAQPEERLVRVNGRGERTIVKVHEAQYSMGAPIDTGIPQTQWRATNGTGRSPATSESKSENETATRRRTTRANGSNGRRSKR